MRQLRAELISVGAVIALLSPPLGAQNPYVTQNPYVQPLKPVGFRARAVVLPPRRIGATVIRSQQALAVEIQVQVRDYMPRDMEPTLLINGAPAGVSAGVMDVQGDVTTLGFVVEKPDLLQEGATLALQVGDVGGTRAAVRGVLRRAVIEPLPEDEAQRSGLPPLSEWLRQKRSSP